MATSEKFSKKISFNSYFAVGTKDEKFKFGGGLHIPISIKNQIAISLNYKNDISESGLVTLQTDKIQKAENYRMLVVNRFDKVEVYEGQLALRLLYYLRASLFLKQTQSRVIGSYAFGNVLQNNFIFKETGLSLRYAFREKFICQSTRLITLKTKYPIIYFQYTLGIKNASLTNSVYQKLDLKIEKSFTFRGFGESRINFNAGKIFGNVPYAISYNSRANRSDRLTIVSKNNFETMYSNEFLSSQYISLFFTHDFGKLLLRTEKFQPGFSVVTNLAIGSLSNASEHFGIHYKVLDKGFMESGIIVSDLIKFKSNLYSSGIGFGGYYRYGNYAFEKAIDNFTFKLDFRISF